MLENLFNKLVVIYERNVGFSMDSSLANGLNALGQINLKVKM